MNEMQSRNLKRKVLIAFALLFVAIDVSICVGNSVMFSSLDRRLDGCKIEDAGAWFREDEKHHSYHVEYVGEWIVVKSSYTSALGVIYLILTGTPTSGVGFCAYYCTNGSWRHVYIE